MEKVFMTANSGFEGSECESECECALHHRHVQTRVCGCDADLQQLHGAKHLRGQTTAQGSAPADPFGIKVTHMNMCTHACTHMCTLWCGMNVGDWWVLVCCA